MRCAGDKGITPYWGRGLYIDASMIFKAIQGPFPIISHLDKVTLQTGRAGSHGPLKLVIFRAIAAINPYSVQGFSSYRRGTWYLRTIRSLHPPGQFDTSWDHNQPPRIVSPGP